MLAVAAIVVCLCVGHSSEPYKIAETFEILFGVGADSCWLKKTYIRLWCTASDVMANTTEWFLQATAIITVASLVAVNTVGVQKLCASVS